MTDLMERLKAALDEDERLALESEGAWIPLGPAECDERPIARHMARHDPARTLAMVAAHRTILTWAENAIKMCTVSEDGVLGKPGEHMMGDIGRWNIQALAKAYGLTP
jgi:hypothetical protein